MSKKTVAIIQARMGSTRLPGKVLKPILNKPLLWHLINRLQRCSTIDQIVVATTTDESDSKIIEFCKENAINYFSGSENDVLDRYYQAAKSFNADSIVRITADCPVIDPQIVDEVIHEYIVKKHDVCGLSGEFPDGLDVTVFSFKTLEDTWRNAKLPSEREHVCPYMSKHPEKFKLGEYVKFDNLGHYRWTVDEVQDLQFIREVFSRLYEPGEIFLTEDILNLLEREPELSKINEGIVRNQGYAKSLTEDEEFLKGRLS
jgi:spore coat polysaccharide biosynthesis protein SpsF